MSEDVESFNTVPVGQDRRSAVIAQLIAEGGVMAAVRRIVYGWHGRFSSVQIHIAVTRRWPLLVPNQHQVGDCLEAMERRRIIKCVTGRRSKIYERSWRDP